MQPGSDGTLDYESYQAFIDTARPSGAAVQARALPNGAGRIYRIRAMEPLPDPAVPELTLHLLTAGSVDYKADFCFGRFEGTKRIGDFDLVPPGTRGVFEGEGTFELLTLAIPWSTVEEIGQEAGRSGISDLGVLHSRMTNSPAVEQGLRALWDDAGERMPFGSMLCEAGVTMLVTRLLRLSEEPVPSSPAARAKGGLAAWQVKRVRDYIEADLTRELTVRELADLCRLSPFHFARAFHQTLGLTPHSYVVTRRMAEAERLLRSTTLPVAEVATRVGYGEASHFARAFRRIHGATPVAYRRQL